jgi:hypothetical protein
MALACLLASKEGKEGKEGKRVNMKVKVKSKHHKAFSHGPLPMAECEICQIAKNRKRVCVRESKNRYTHTSNFPSFPLCRIHPALHTHSTTHTAHVPRSILSTAV